ncbi:hypothetical protein KBY28_20545 [Ruegeria pomeroyi]|uniref:hypothetical protein n=1 Tax=Ruegeria pomeroyi TaxID=89184 RepID=UPI001F163881|nr:hypothetical protein [Ruegeria pomeroyi]MCE8510848.1 hypothetical protein [Ruegeria pomeroyi]
MKKFFGPSSRKVPEVKSSGGVHLSVDEVNSLEHGFLFDSVISRQDTWDACDSVPIIRDGVSHIAIPYSYDLHHEVNLNGQSLESKLTEFLNVWMSYEKYFVSCDPAFFFGLKCRDFSYDYVDLGVESGGWNSHFVLFDDRKDKWVVFYSRFPFLTISWKENSNDPMIGGEEKDFWRKYFLDQSVEAMKGQSPAFVEFINRTYIPRLKGYKSIKI